MKVNVGQYVSNGTEIVRVEDRSSMKVDFAIAQNLLEKLHIGQKSHRDSRCPFRRNLLGNDLCD